VRDDQLNAARGIIVALGISLVLWIIIVVLVVAVFKF
jgi:hypothetical protein